MKKKKLPNHLHTAFLLLSFLILVFAYSLFSPRVYGTASTKLTWSDVMEVAQTQGSFPVRMFWQFREFAAAGSFIFNPEGTQLTEATLRHVGDGFINSDFDKTLHTLTFNSTHVHSAEFLSQSPRLPSYTGGQVLQQTDTYRVIELSDAYIIIYIQPTREMLALNGFYKYPGRDEERINTHPYALSIHRVVK